MATTPGGRPPRFPGYDVMSQVGNWDHVTAGVVLGRLAPPPPLRFFSREEEPTARALVDRLLAQDDEPRVPVLEMIDQRLVEGVGDGYRYAEMPEDADAWRRSIANLDAEARARHGRPFWDLDVPVQNGVVEAVRTVDGDWRGLPAKRVFDLWVRYACSAFYAHPWAWNEIGFGGPAYPRGYKSLGFDHREHWEVADTGRAQEGLSG